MRKKKIESNPPEANEKIETAQPQTVTSELQTEQMEVHHHPHVEKKNFKEYFLEFVMIFLAVFLGFCREYKRKIK